MRSDDQKGKTKGQKGKSTFPYGQSHNRTVPSAPNPHHGLYRCPVSLVTPYVYGTSPTSLSATPLLLALLLIPRLSERDTTPAPFFSYLILSEILGSRSGCPPPPGSSSLHRTARPVHTLTPVWLTRFSSSDPTHFVSFWRFI